MGLLNYQIDTIMREYERRQLQSKASYDLRHQEVCDKIPEYNILEQSVGEMSLEAARLSFSGDDNALTRLRDQLHEVSEKKSQLLKMNGFPSDYLAKTYKCPDCKDTGYIGTEKCHCFKEAIVELLYDQSNLHSKLIDHNFAHFNLNYYPDNYTEPTTGLTPKDNIKNVLSVAKSFCQNFSTHKDNLLFYGNTGVGKTFITHCIAKELIENGYTVIYLTSLELFDILEKYKFEKDSEQSTTGATFSYIFSCDLLIIDDLGTELNNSFISSQLYGCIDSRLSANKSTIISTNLSFNDLSTHYSERIFSRLTSNYTLLKIIGDDIRIKKALDSKH